MENKGEKELGKLRIRKKKRHRIGHLNIKIRNREVMEMYFHFLPAFHKLTCSLTSWDWDHVSPRAAFSSLTLSPQVESVSSEQFIQPVYLELLSPSLRNLRKYVHHGTKMQMWPVLQPDLYLPHPYLAGICFFSSSLLCACVEGKVIWLALGACRKGCVIGCTYKASPSPQEKTVPL